MSKSYNRACNDRAIDDTRDELEEEGIIMSRHEIEDIIVNGQMKFVAKNLLEDLHQSRCFRRSHSSKPRYHQSRRSCRTSDCWPGPALV